MTEDYGSVAIAIVVVGIILMIGTVIWVYAWAWHSHEVSLGFSEGMEYGWDEGCDFCQLDWEKWDCTYKKEGGS